MCQSAASASVSCKATCRRSRQALEFQMRMVRVSSVRRRGRRGRPSCAGWRPARDCSPWTLCRPRYQFPVIVVRIVGLDCRRGHFGSGAPGNRVAFQIASASMSWAISASILVRSRSGRKIDASANSAETNAAPGKPRQTRNRRPGHRPGAKAKVASQDAANLVELGFAYRGDAGPQIGRRQLAGS